MRVFFAIDLPKAHKQHLAACLPALKERLPQPFFHWVPAENFHLTLQFLGEVKETEIAALLRAVREQLRQQAPFYLRLEPLEWFPSPEHPRVLSLRAWPHEALAALALAIARGLKLLGYAVLERSFRGHVTLARIEGEVFADSLAAFSLPQAPEIFVNQVVLFQSELQEGRAVYTPLDSIDLF